MLSLSFVVAAIAVAQVALVVPVADLLTRKLGGENATPRGIPAGALRA